MTLVVELASSYHWLVNYLDGSDKAVYDPLIPQYKHV